MRRVGVYRFMESFSSRPALVRTRKSVSTAKKLRDGELNPGLHGDRVGD